jgi:hypothetical protein
LITLEIKLPMKVLQCIALLYRLPRNHPSRPVIEKDLKAMLKGYYGEKECDYYLGLLPEDQYYIFHGLQLTDKKPFQMDLLLLCQAFALIVEVKNIKKLIFQKGSDHVTIEFNNEKEGISNPIQQVKRQKIQFDNWLAKAQIRGVPVERIVAISKNSTVIETTPDNLQIFNELIYAEGLIDKVEELERKYQTPRLSKRKLAQLVDLLLDHHHTPILSILKKYNISIADIQTGVQCPSCRKFAMIYFSANWHCPHCHCISKTAFQKTVDDYFLLINPTMTRKQFAEFLQIESTHIAKNLLRGLNLPSTGSKRSTKYFLPKNELLCPLTEKEINLYTIPTHIFPTK